MKRPEPMLYLIAAATVAVLSFAYLLPIYVMLMTALKTPAEITQRTYLLPGASAQLENFATAWRLIRPAMANSAFIALAVTGAALLFGSMGGYFLSRSRSLIARALFLLIGIALYLPYQVILIPLVQVMARTGLALTHAGLILSYLVLNMPLASVLMGTFFLSIPRELEEAAALDGASRLQNLRPRCRSPLPPRLCLYRPHRVHPGVERIPACPHPGDPAHHYHSDQAGGDQRELCGPL
jgi:ABC-type glycerol-3-phosphate transport system permease component